jgi:hypothetical protein
MPSIAPSFVSRSLELVFGRHGGLEHFPEKVPEDLGDFHAAMPHLKALERIDGIWGHFAVVVLEDLVKHLNLACHAKVPKRANPPTQLPIRNARRRGIALANASPRSNITDLKQRSERRAH